MNWKDTVMSWEGIRIVFQEEDEKGTTDPMFRMDALCQRQAEITFKAGMKVVVDWMGWHSDIGEHINMYHEEEWQAKLKEWGLDESR